MIRKVLVLFLSVSALASEPAKASCHEGGLFQAAGIHEMLLNSRGRHTSALTVVPSPTAPQNLGELHERMVDALVFALGRDQNLPTFLFTASSASNTFLFPQTELVGVPNSLAIATPARSLNPTVKLRYLTESGTNATCFYKAAAGAYVFDFCAPTVLETACEGAWGALCKGAVNLGIRAGDTVVARSVQLPIVTGSALRLQAAFPNVTGACEGLAKSNVHLLQNLVCTTPNHVALEVLGAKNMVDGHGYAVKSAGSEIGLFLSGDGSSVRNIDVSGVAGGYGLMAYNTNGLTVINSRFRSNLVGADVYTDNANTSGLQIVNNDFSGNAFSGLIFNGDGKQTDSPFIAYNNFQNIGGYALAIDARNASISGSQNNEYTGSKGALYLSNGNFSVAGLNLSHSGATGPQIFVDSAQSLSVSNTNLTYTASAQPSQERTALHLYRVGSVNISRLTVTNSDVAFKATTESGTNTSISVTDSSFTNAKTAAIMLQSWDNTVFGKVTIRNNVLTGAPAGYSIWQVGNTALGAGSSVIGNVQ